MDELARYNKERWEELAQANIVFSCPALDLDVNTARKLIDPHDLVGNLNGRSVLCLASGGGQQSAAFGLLGAEVTVFDISKTQLQRDAKAAAHYGLTILFEQGDMRDLLRFAEDSFDIVCQPPSINFVPDARQVFSEVARVIRRDGFYRVDCANPFTMGIDDRDWNGEGYTLRHPYLDGAEVATSDPRWEIWDGEGHMRLMDGPKEFRHTLGSMINGLIENRFVILGLWEKLGSDVNAIPGTWNHFELVAPPIFSIWSRYRLNMGLENAG